MCIRDRLGTHRLGGGALQGEVAHALCVQPLGQQLKHGGELAEQQDAVPTLHGTGDQLDAGIDVYKRQGCHNVDQRLSWIVLPPITSSPSQSKPDGFD